MEFVEIQDLSAEKQPMARDVLSSLGLGDDALFEADFEPSLPAGKCYDCSAVLNLPGPDDGYDGHRGCLACKTVMCRDCSGGYYGRLHMCVECHTAPMQEDDEHCGKCGDEFEQGLTAGDIGEMGGMCISCRDKTEAAAAQ